MDVRRPCPVVSRADPSGRRVRPEGRSGRGSERGGHGHVREHERDRHRVSSSLPHLHGAPHRTRIPQV